jgi:hypothetical protein
MQQPEGIKKEGLELLRQPFPQNQINKLPKPTISSDEYKKLPKGKCKECGGYHATTNTIHLDYIGHAALTDRLLDADPSWSWEPMATKDGLPAFDATGGLWIRLTVCDMTRIGYGNAKANSFADVGSREKEVIGDALRNAAMRFGAALDLWHKGDLHIEDDASNKMEKPPPKNTEPDVPENLGTPPNLTNFETKTTYLKEVRIAEGISKSGKNKGKPFTRYDVIDEDDKLYGTFDAKINDRAKAAIYNKALVKITYQVGQYGNNLMGMVVEGVDIP